jgi:hypothetical protein
VWIKNAVQLIMLIMTHALNASHIMASPFGIHNWKSAPQSVHNYTVLHRGQIAHQRYRPESKLRWHFCELLCCTRASPPAGLEHISTNFSSCILVSTPGEVSQPDGLLSFSPHRERMLGAGRVTQGTICHGRQRRQGAPAGRISAFRLMHRVSHGMRVENTHSHASRCVII